MCPLSVRPFFFFVNDTATTEIYTLSLHDALPIWVGEQVGDRSQLGPVGLRVDGVAHRVLHPRVGGHDERSRQRGADEHQPRRSHAGAGCPPGGGASQPKTQKPRNVDSRKKAASPSIASGAPNTSPTNREYADQFMPNSNSCTSPLTTPTAPLISRMFPKKRVRRRWSGFRERYHIVCKIAMRNASPIVIGTKMKW